MSQAFTQLVGIAGAALCLANFAPDAFSASIAALHETAIPTAPDPVQRVLKADRLPVARPSPRATAVFAIELAGDNQMTVILRDRAGQVLYRSDLRTNTTEAVKNADVPNITVKEASQIPMRTQPESVPERKEGLEEKGKRRVPAGCESVVSPLVNHELRKVSSLCFT